MPGKAFTDCVGMRGRMVMLIAVAMLPLAGFIGLSIASDYQNTMAQARRDVLQAATLAATRQSQLFATSRILLDALRRAPAVTVAGGAECERTLAMIKEANPQFRTVGVTDAEGTITCHNLIRKPQAFGDPALVARIMADGAPNFIVGDFVVGTVTQKPTVVLAMPMRDAFGLKIGVIFASLDLDKLADKVESVSLGGRRSVAIIQAATGRVLTHYPLAPFPQGQIFADHPLMAAMRNGPAGGVTEGRGFVDGDRVFGFAPIEGAETGGLMLAVGESRASLLAPVRAKALYSVGGGAIVVVLALLAAGWLGSLLQVRPVMRLAHIAARIGAGHFGARARLASWQAPELRYLDDTLSRMAVHLAAGQEAVRAVAASEAKYRLLAENTADLVTCVDMTGRRIFVSPASVEMLGRTPEEMTGAKPVELVHPDDRPAFDAMMAKLRAGEVVTGFQHRYRHGDGHYIWVEISGRPTEDGQIVFAVRDVTKRRQMEDDLAEANRQLATLASTDALTGLLNRRAFDQTLARDFAIGTADRTDLSLLMIDVDRFKSFNDRYGHPVGDDCLRRIAATFRVILRRPGTAVARYGGEEFAVILAGAPLSVALQEAEALRRAIREMSIENAASEYGVITISVGVATLTGAHGLATPLELVQRADAALYDAKARGRDRIEIGLQAIAEAS